MRKGAGPPSLAIVLDNVPSDGPGRSDARGSKIGAGPVLRRYDHQPMSLYGYITPPELIRWVKDVASDARVPLQEDVFVGTFLDSATFEQIPAGRLARRADQYAQALFPQPGGNLYGIGLRSHGGAHRRPFCAPPPREERRILRRDYLSPSDA